MHFELCFTSRTTHVGFFQKVSLIQELFTDIQIIDEI